MDKYGDGTLTRKQTQQKVAENIYTIVGVGSYHTAALDIEGNIWSWGSNEFGQLGFDNIGQKPIRIKVIKQNSED